MKRIIKHITWLSVAIFLAPTIAFAQFDTSLGYGASGPKVSELQEFLVAQNLLAPQFVTGNFYSLTLQAVKAFQNAEGILPTSGYFGPITRTYANAILNAPVTEGTVSTSSAPIDLATTTAPVTQAPIQTTIQPTFGSITTNQPTMDKSALLVTPIYTPTTQGRGPSEGMPFGQYGFEVSVLDSDGNYIKNAAVTLTSDLAPDTQYTKDADSGVGKWGRGFNYVPQTVGQKTLTFTSGNLTQTIVLNVQ